MTDANKIKLGGLWNEIWNVLFASFILIYSVQFACMHFSISYIVKGYRVYQWRESITGGGGRTGHMGTAVCKLRVKLACAVNSSSFSVWTANIYSRHSHAN